MKRVLLADDSVAARKSIQTVLEVAGIDVVAVGNGDLALSRLGDVRPEMVLLDAIMPGRSGYEVCAEIKGNDRSSGIPVLLITTEFEPFDQAYAESVGADGHLIKPFDMSAITMMREVWQRYAPADAETLAAVEKTGSAEAKAAALAMPPPGPDAFITATMRAIDVEAAEAARAAEPKPDETVPGGAGARPKMKETWHAAVPDHVVDVTDSLAGRAPALRRAPTTENLDVDIAAEAEDRARAVSSEAVRSVPIQDLHAASEWCTACGAVLVSGDIFCIECGAMVLVTAEEAERAAHPPVCLECRQELLPGEIFCVACGAVV
jgi:CheY-like chemotaxis protein